MKPKNVKYAAYHGDNGNMSWASSTGNEYLDWIVDVFGIEANMSVEGSPSTKKMQNQREIDKISYNDYLNAIGCTQI